MSEKKCAICLEYTYEEEPAVIAMSGYGTPLCACERCAGLLSTAMESHNYDEIVSSMDSLYEIMKAKNNDHPLVVEIMSENLNHAAQRAVAIKEGTYDFTQDEAAPSESEESFDEVPEELRESEEDRALDEKEKAQNEKFDKVMNIVTWVALGACVIGIALAWLFIF